MESKSPACRSPRVSSQQKSEALVRAAREVFAKQGLHVPLDEIAQRAGVSRTTMRKHFPDRASLFAAIFKENVNHLERLVREIGSVPDAFEKLMAAIIEQQAINRGFTELSFYMGYGNSIKEETAAAFVRSIEESLLRARMIIDEPLRRAKRAGRVRADVDIDDVELMVMMVGSAVDHGPGIPPSANGQRALMLLFDGLRPR
jgi:AcrR family transcriptional regulator